MHPQKTNLYMYRTVRVPNAFGNVLRNVRRNALCMLLEHSACLRGPSTYDTACVRTRIVCCPSRGKRTESGVANIRRHHRGQLGFGALPLECQVDESSYWTCSNWVKSRWADFFHRKIWKTRSDQCRLNWFLWIRYTYCIRTPVCFTCGSSVKTLLVRTETRQVGHGQSG